MIKRIRIVVFLTFFMALAVTGTVRAAEKAEQAAAGPSVQFVELNPLILPIIGDRGVMQVISLVVSVEVDSEEKAEQVRKYSPRLTDAFLSDLYGTFSNVADANGGDVPIAYIKERLSALSNKVLGGPIVSDVLLQVMQRRST